MITQLKIENFKDLKHLELEKLTYVTLLSGKNNVGKTSILEAILLLFNYLTVYNLIPIFGNRGSNLELDKIDFEQALTGIFNEHNLNNNIKISIPQHELNITFNNNVEFNLQYNPQSQNNQTSNMNSSLDNQSIYIDYTYKNTNYFRGIVLKDIFSAQATYNPINQIINRQIAASIKRNIFVIDDRGELMAGEDIASRYSKDRVQRFNTTTIDEFGKIRFNNPELINNELITALKILDEHINNIELGLDTFSGRPRIELIKTGVKRPIPLNEFGDGTKRVFNIILGIIAAKDGILLIDEIENGIHYSAIKDLWRVIFTLSKKYGCQIIATTHSWEFPSYLAYELPKEYEENFSFINITKLNDEHGNSLASSTYNYNDFKYAITNNSEIR